MKTNAEAAREADEMMQMIKVRDREARFNELAAHNAELRLRISLLKAHIANLSSMLCDAMRQEGGFK